MKYIYLLFATLTFGMAEGFTLTSHDIAGQLTLDQVANTFGCKGHNISPQLSWSDAPKETKSFAITVYDPDAPTGSGWWHWQVVNIPVGTMGIQTGASGKHLLPKGAVEIANDYGFEGFGGACPPIGDKPHQYIFTIHALDVDRLPVEATTNAPIVGYQINAHTIAKASLIAYYGR